MVFLLCGCKTKVKQSRFFLELKQGCVSNDKNLQHSGVYSKQAIKKGYLSSIQEMKELLLMSALKNITLQINTNVESASSSISKKNIKSITETSRTTGSYVYSQYIHMNVINQLIDKKEGGNYESSYQEMAELIFRKDTILFSSRTVISSMEAEYTEDLTIGKNKNWYNDVIEELEDNGMIFNFTEDKREVGLCISLKKDLIKKE